MNNNLICFLIVALFNTYWLIRHGIEVYCSLYNPKENGLLSIPFILYAAWGIYCLVTGLIIALNK